MSLEGKHYILTDQSYDYDFFKPYIESGQWVEANELYGSGISSITEGSQPFYHHYINHIENYDLKLKKFVISLFRQLSIKPKDFRCDFFLTKEGGHLPEHIDGRSLMAILIPLTENTGDLIIRHEQLGEERLCYQSMIVLDTQVPHSVHSPKKDRLVFRLGIHDTPFKDIKWKGEPIQQPVLA